MMILALIVRGARATIISQKLKVLSKTNDIYVKVFVIVAQQKKNFGNWLINDVTVTRNV